MKKIAFIALGTMLFASCSEDGAPQLPVENRIDLSVEKSVVLSRTTTAENEGVIRTTFVADDMVGVYAEGGATASNVEYKVAADGSKLETANPVVFQSDLAASLHAYSPYVADATATGVAFTISADQSSAESFNASNFMTSAATVTKEAPSASLGFTPRMALVYVEMDGELGVETNSLSICGMKQTLNWTAASDAIETAGEAANIVMHKASETAPVFMAFVPAQTSTAGEPLFSIGIGSERYSYTPAGGIEFKSNTVKRFVMTVNVDKTVNIETSVIDGIDWTEDGEKTVIESGEIVHDRVELISASEGDFTGKVLSQVTGLQGAVEGWNAIVASPAAGAISISGDEAVIETLTGTAGWYQRALVYRTPNGKGSAKKYRLEFDVKGGTDIQVAVMRGQTKDVFTGNAYFNVAGATASGKIEKTEAEYTHKSLVVDLSAINNGAVDFSTGITVVFNAKDAKSDQTHYIKNVSFVEAVSE